MTTPKTKRTCDPGTTASSSNCSSNCSKFNNEETAYLYYNMKDGPEKAWDVPSNGPESASSAPRITLSVSDAFYNKDKLQGKRAHHTNFSTRNLTLPELVDHISCGKTFAPACFKGNYRAKNNFQSAQMLALDLDDAGLSIEELAQDPFIREYACIIYATPSSTPEHPRSRVLFRLSEPVIGAVRFEALQTGLIRLLDHLKPDPACKDASRMYHGSAGCENWPGYENVLPLEMVGDLTYTDALDEDKRLTARQVHREKPNLQSEARDQSASLSPNLVAEVERQFGVAGEPTDSDGFVGRAIACPIRNHEHDHVTPAAHWHPDKKLVYCFKCGKSYLTHQVAESLGIDVKHYYRPPFTPHPAFDLDTVPDDDNTIHVDYKFISDYDFSNALMPDGALLVKSHLGSGKTEAIIKQIVANPNHKVLVIVHRRSLVRHLEKRLNKSLRDHGHGNRQFESYENLSGPQLRQPSLLVICVNSLYKLLSEDQPTPRYDLIILDEVEQMLSHLTGNTFEGQEAVTAFDLLEDLIGQSQYTIALDAYATALSRDWLRSLKATNLLYNTYKRKRVKMVIWENSAQVITVANKKIANADSPIVITVSSKKLAMVLYSYYSGDMVLPWNELEEIQVDDGTPVADMLGNSFYGGNGLGKDAVAVIHGDNSQTADTQDLMNDIDKRLLGLKVLIYNSAMGTGVDIQTEASCVLGLFDSHTLPADEIHQMIGRCRKATEFHICIPAHSGSEITDSEALYQRERSSLRDTGRLYKCKSSVSWEIGGGKNRLCKNQEKYLRLWSKIEGKTTHSKNNLLGHFIYLAQGEFDITFRTANHDSVSEKLENLRTAQETIDKHLVLTSPSIDEETYQRLCEQGKCTPVTKAGFIRWGIEHGYRQPITSKIYDHWEDGGLNKLRNFINLHSNQEDVIALDEYQDAKGYAVPFRSHFAMKRNLIREVLDVVWGNYDDLNDTQYVSLDHISTVMGPFIQKHKKHMWCFFKWRLNHSPIPKNVLRRLLKEIGLSLECPRAGIYKGLYGIKRDDLKTMLDYMYTYQQSRDINDNNTMIA